jgi:polysaccharide biosynthesis protein PslA
MTHLAAEYVFMSAGAKPRRKWIVARRRLVVGVLPLVKLTSDAAILVASVGVFYAYPVPWKLAPLMLILSVAAAIMLVRKQVGTVVFAWLVDTLSAKGYLIERVAIISANEHAGAIFSKLSDAIPQWHVIGIFHDDVRSSVEKKYSKNIDDLITEIRAGHVDRIVIRPPETGADRIAPLLERLKAVSIDVVMLLEETPITTWYGRKSLKSLPMIRVAQRPLSPLQFVIKLLADKVSAGVMLLLLVPLMLTVALLIRFESPGPILFRQIRTGFNNEPIEVFKFRTMYDNLRDENGSTLVSRGDPRVTPFGILLRRFSLDELPQLLNVLRGDMSLVGPRPHPLSAKAAGQLYPEVMKDYVARHRVRPGITGWAQVNGWRGKTDTREKLEHRVECDFFYIDHWSLLFDLKIVLRTLGVIWTGKNAI